MKNKDLQEWEEYMLKQETARLREYCIAFIVVTALIIIAVCLS